MTLAPDPPPPTRSGTPSKPDGANPDAADLVPTGVQRSPKRDRTRQAILQAAYSLYTRDGYGAVTMRAIAHQMGFSAPAIYNYFLSKEEIFIALQEIGLQLMAETVLSEPTGDPVENVRLIYWRYYLFTKSHPDYFTLLYVDPSAPPIDDERPQAEPLRRMRDESGRRLQRCLDEGIFPAKTAAIVPVGPLLWSIVHGAAVLRRVQRLTPTTDFDAIAATGLDLAINAIRAGLLEASTLHIPPPPAPFSLLSKRT
jgi:AcrR family transcriptional regulator